MTELEQDHLDQMKTNEERFAGRACYLRQEKLSGFPTSWNTSQRVAFLDGWVSQWAEDRGQKNNT